MNDPIKINWYRSPVDRAVLSELMQTSDARGFLQVLPQLALFAITGALAYAAFLNVSSLNWPWAVPLLLGALFVHGTFSSFLGSVGPVHELCHKTPFRSKGLNEFFLKIFSFLSWSDYIGFRPSHVKHHPVTVHTDHDGEVVLRNPVQPEPIRIAKEAIDEVSESPVSIMPAGLVRMLENRQEFDDLLRFVLETRYRP